MRISKIFISFLLVFVLCVSIVIAVACSPFDTTQNDIITDNNEDVVDDNGETIPENKVVDMPSNIVFRSVPKRAVNETRQSIKSVTLKATVKPSYATNQKVDWNVAFVNSSSTWANGKTVTDYVTVTPTTDGALTANVSYFAAFGEQIKITVTSRNNPDATATCILDCQKVVASVSVRLVPSSGTTVTLSNTNIGTVTSTIVGGTTYTPTVMVTESVGTLSSEYKITKSYVALRDDFYSALGLTYDQTWYNINRCVEDSKLATSLLVDLSLIDNLLDYDSDDEDKVYVAPEAIKQMLDRTTINHMYWYVSVQDKAGTVTTKQFYFKVDVSNITIPVNQITLDKNSYIF